MSYTFTILGCGSSAGVPRVGGDWGACDPNEPRNRRRRCSMLVERSMDQHRTTVLVDLSPDVREQLLSAQVKKIDGVLVTHDHADHIHGIDDLRPLSLIMKKRIDVYMATETAKTVIDRFGYCFATPQGSDYPPIVTHRPFPEKAMIEIDGAAGGIKSTGFWLDHGVGMKALGFRFETQSGALAYTPDVKTIPAEAEEYLYGLEVWIVDALRIAPHISHFCLSDALSAIEKYKPRRAILTNLHVDLDYATLKNTLPAHVAPAYDGMQIVMA